MYHGDTRLELNLIQAATSRLGPKQYPTGGKPRLDRITKHVDKYLRMLLFHGSRTVIANIGDKQDRLSQWCQGVLERRGMNRAIVALAAKNARIIWSLLQSNRI